MSLNRLCLWFADRVQLPLFVIDPLKADVSALTQVMSQEFAIRNHILAVEIHADRIVIGTDQPFQTDWLNNLERSLAPKKIERVLLNPEQLQRYLREYYQVSRAVNSAQKDAAHDRDSKMLKRFCSLAIAKTQMLMISIL